MKFLNWYAVVVLVFTILILVVDWSSMSPGQESEETLLAIIIFSPVAYHEIKMLIELYRGKRSKKGQEDKE
jgi:hypothetical protein